MRSRRTRVLVKLIPVPTADCTDRIGSESLHKGSAGATRDPATLFHRHDLGDRFAMRRSDKKLCPSQTVRRSFERYGFSRVLSGHQDCKTNSSKSFEYRLLAFRVRRSGRSCWQGSSDQSQSLHSRVSCSTLRRHRASNIAIPGSPYRNET